MPGEAHGEVIDLVWPEGNDDGDLFIKGHLPDDDARERILHESDELETLADRTFADDCDPCEEDMDDRCHSLAVNAEVVRGYGRWSREAVCIEENLNGILRFYLEPGRGRFPVTRVTLWPRKAEAATG